MNEQEQRIAIAEACGWTKAENGFWLTPEGYYGVNTRCVVCHGAMGNCPPDYLQDLNAMHEAEERLKQDPNDCCFYIAELWGVLKLADPSYEAEARGNDFYFAVATATAAQRAEAFLRVLGKWKE